jgi:CheY-like chemotaxis protein
MEHLATQPLAEAYEPEPRLRLLVADDDRLERSLLAFCARERVDRIAVLEARDGAEAVQLGLQLRPEIALLDVNMPRLGGIEAAVTLREMRLALHTADPLAHRERARAHHLPLFGKLELDHTLAWLAAQARWHARTQPEPGPLPRRGFACGACGYGVFRPAPPARCPMCQAEDAWVHAPRRSAALSTG